MTSITGTYFSKRLLNCDGSGAAAVGLMDVLTPMAGRELEIKVRSECAVFCCLEEGPSFQVPGTGCRDQLRPGQAGRLSAARLGCAIWVERVE